MKAERFGLCARWDQKMSLEDFIGEICQIIDAQLTMDPASGKYSLKLIRPDYEAESLLVLGPSDIISLDDFTRPDPNELVNQVTIVYENWETGVEQSITESNAAALALNPEMNSVEMKYQAVPMQELARRIAFRELAQFSAWLATCTIQANRKAALLKMGDCFVLNWPKLGIESMVMRVTYMAQGSSTGWMVKISCVQDVDGVPDISFQEVGSGWTPPSVEPAALDAVRLYELPYHLVSAFVTYDNDSAWADLPAGYGYLAIAASPPSAVTTGFKINTLDAYGAWSVDRTLAFLERGGLAQRIDDVATTFSFSSESRATIGSNLPILVDDEWMLVKGGGSQSLTVERGCMDTVPAAHELGVIIWFCGSYNNVLPKTYVSGQTASVKLQPTGAGGDMPLDREFYIIFY